MHRPIPVPPGKLIPDLPSTYASVSLNKLVAVSMILAIDTIFYTILYPLVAGT
jgi:hypothetical protein